MTSCGQILRAEAKPAVVRIFDEAESERYFPKIGRRVTTIFISEGESEYTTLDGRVIRRISRENGGKSSGEEPVNIWLKKRFDIGLGPVLMQHGGIVDTIEVSALFKDAAKLYRDMVASMKAVEGRAGGLRPLLAFLSRGGLPVCDLRRHPQRPATILSGHLECCYGGYIEEQWLDKSSPWCWFLENAVYGTGAGRQRREASEIDKERTRP